MTNPQENHNFKIIQQESIITSLAFQTQETTPDVLIIKRKSVQMGTRRNLINMLNRAVSKVGYALVRLQDLYPWQRPRSIEMRTPDKPDDSPHYLNMENPRLVELKSRYATFNTEVTAPLEWTDTHVSPDDLRVFRGDNAYVWQTRVMSMNVMSYALTAYYTKSHDHLGLLEKITEDGSFGAHYLEIAGKKISRDLLDSILEINFLDQYLGISSHPNLSILDIGAGYGRLAHRMIESIPNVKRYFCADAFPVSTFIQEYYLRFRNQEDTGTAVALDEIEETMRNNPIDIAINIHSFSECRPSAINWWVGLLGRHKVRHLMIIPNFPELITNDGTDFSGMLNKHGYRLRVKQPKYADPVVQEYGINPSYYYLFELADTQ